MYDITIFLNSLNRIFTQQTRYIQTDNQQATKTAKKVALLLNFNSIILIFFF